MVRMAQKKESADCEYLTNGDIGAGMSFLGDLEPATGNEVRDRDTEPGKVDRSQTKEACEEDDDIDDDVAMTFPQRVSLKGEGAGEARQSSSPAREG